MVMGIKKDAKVGEQDVRALAEGKTSASLSSPIAFRRLRPR